LPQPWQSQVSQAENARCDNRRRRWKQLCIERLA